MNDKGSLVLIDSLSLWRSVTGSKQFRNTPFILLFNKIDLFEKNLAEYPLSEIFSNYSEFCESSEVAGKSEEYKAYRFIKSLFLQFFKGSEYKHSSLCAIDVKSCKQVATSPFFRNRF
eukprot:TRINITY_DN5010_c0_g1_i1.p2 TRINITY_DN5010_c0_g1~~TRINITY_DN5010_c0_g1_i1.p2  ORF type:complete len:118 (-),score=18.13 TRINITY_DN5010_c0_g1_i1:65-418(-)